MELIHLGTRVVNSYLYRGAEGYVLVDTGYESRYPGFLRALASRGLNPMDIRCLFLTHAHDDHAGFLNALLRDSQAEVILSPQAIDGLRRGQNAFRGGCSGRLAQTFCKGMALLGRGEHRFPPVEPELEARYLPVSESNRRELECLLSGRIIATPGHTGCSISLLREDGILFCGDAAMNGFPSLHRATIWIEDLSAFCQSWRTILSLMPRQICPGHGAPFPASDLRRYLPLVEQLTLYPLSKRTEME